MLMSFFIPFLLEGDQLFIIALIIILPLFLFIVLPILLAIKYPTFRIALGVVDIVLGLLLIIGLWWLLGLGLFIGVPTLLLGVVFLVSGSTSKAKELRAQAVPTTPQRFCVSCGRAVTGGGRFCSYCGKELPP